MQSKARSARGRRASPGPETAFTVTSPLPMSSRISACPLGSRVDHEQVLDRLLHDGAKAREDRPELLPVGGLRDEAHGALAQAALELVGRGDQEDRDVTHLAGRP